MELLERKFASPEADSWIFQVLRNGGIKLYPVEGYSVKKDIVTAVFERRLSTGEVEAWSEENIEEWLEIHEDRDAWFARSLLAEFLNVPLYLVIYQEGKESFRIMSVVVDELRQIEVSEEKIFDTCEDLAKWMSKLKGIPVRKRFFVRGRLSSIDKCLRQHGVPWPGNLDGFHLDRAGQSIKAIFEFSRTRKRKVRVVNHDIRPFFYQDFNRWEPLRILQNQLDVPLFVVLWSSVERVIKLHKVQSITRTGIIYESTEMIPERRLVPRFTQILET